MLDSMVINHVSLEGYTSIKSLADKYCVITSDRDKDIYFPGWFPSRVVFSTERQMHYAEAMLYLTILSDLEPNWDAYGAEPIGRECIDNARSVLSALSASIPSPEITPNPNGTVTFDWETEDQVLSLEIGATHYSSFWNSLNGLRTDEGMLGEGVPNFVNRALASMFTECDWVMHIYNEWINDVQGTSGVATYSNS